MGSIKGVGVRPKVAEAHQEACGGTFRDGEGVWRVCNLVVRHAGPHKGPTVEEFEAKERGDADGKTEVGP